VGAVDTLIGDIVPPEDLMKTLTDRKLAEQEKVTYNTQKLAEETRKELAQARAIADTQPRVVDAERTVSIAEFNAQSVTKKAQGEANAKTINAEADAKVLMMVGDAEGRKITAVGTAEAEVIQKKTNAVGQGNYAMIEIGRALAAARIPLVPHIVAGGGSGEQGGASSLVNVLLAQLLSGELKTTTVQPKVEAAPSGGETTTTETGGENR
jgi:regulator of protease activity HflC (stomatin/prohibitin superfamily)